MDNCKCGRKILKGYRVFNWEYINSSKYYDTYDEAKKYYDQILGVFPHLQWRLYEDIVCEGCEYIDDNCLEVAN